MEPTPEQVSTTSLEDRISQAVSSPALTDAASPATSSTTSSTPVSATPAAGEVASQEQAAFDFLTELRTRGYQVPDGARPQDILGQITEALSHLPQLQQLAQYGQMAAPHWTEFQNYLVAKQQQQQTQQAQPSGQNPWHQKYWTPPEYDPRWEQMLAVDAQGNVVAKPGTPPDVLYKVQQYQAWKSEQIRKFTDNPLTFLEEPVKDLARQVAMEVLQGHSQATSEAQIAGDFVRQNYTWLYEHDANGQPVMQPQLNAHGQTVMAPVPTYWHGRVVEHVRSLAQSGVRDVEVQKQYALRAVQAEYAALQSQQQQMAAQQAATPQPATQEQPAVTPTRQRATRRASHTGQSPAAPSTATETQGQRAGRPSLLERLQQAVGPA